MTSNSTSMYQREHAKDMHTDAFRPVGCAECWPDGAPALPPPAPTEHLEAAVARAVVRGMAPQPMQAVGSKLAAGKKLFQTGAMGPAPELPPGLAEDGLPECEHCNSRRWVRPVGWTPDVPHNHPTFSKSVPCPACSASRVLQAQIDHWWQHAPRELRTFTMEGLSRCSPEHATLAIALLRWMDIDSDPPPWLCLYGPWGVAKTGAVSALAREFMEQGRGLAILAVVPDMLGWLKATFTGEGDEQSVLNDLKTCDLLVLDDLGKQQQTGWAADRLFQVINFRYNDGRRTIITLNGDPDELFGALGMEAELSRIKHRTGTKWMVNCEDLPNLRERGV